MLIFKNPNCYFYNLLNYFIFLFFIFPLKEPIASNKQKFEYVEFRITEEYLQGFVKETTRKMKVILNKQKVRITKSLP